MAPRQANFGEYAENTPGTGDISPWQPRPDEHNSIQRRVWALPSGRRAMVQAMVRGTNPVNGDEYQRGATFGESADYFAFWSSTHSGMIHEGPDLDKVIAVAKRWLAENSGGGA